MKRTEAESKAREGYDQMADVGCGPGHVTAYLAGLGLDIFVVDNSPVRVVRQPREGERQLPHGTFVARR